MPHPLRDLYLEALELFTAEALGAADNIGLRSACSEWSIADVVRHSIAMQRGNVIGPLQGKPALGGGPELAPESPMEAVTAWEKVATDAEITVRAAPEDALDLLALPIMDLAMHAWDIRYGLVHVGLATPLEFSPTLLAHLEAFAARAQDRHIRVPGVFAAATEAGDDATPTARIMAWGGRPAL